MKNITFSIIMEKIKTITNARNDSEIANILKINKGNYSKYKKNENIPYKSIVEFCIEKNIDLNFIFGLKNVKSNDINTMFQQLSKEEQEMYIYEIKARILRKKLDN